MKSMEYLQTAVDSLPIRRTKKKWGLTLGMGATMALLLAAGSLALVCGTLTGCGGGGHSSSSGTTQNPVPSITSISPSFTTVGSSSQIVTINGSGFISSSPVTFN